MKRIKIEIFEREEYPGRRADEVWQADCGNDHAVGKTPGDAVDRLVSYMGAKEKFKPFPYNT